MPCIRKVYLHRLTTHMTFKTRPSTYRLDVATGLARCRGKCKALVPKGSVRIVTTAFVRPKRATCFTRCASCIDRPFAAAVLAVYTRADRVPVQAGVPTVAASKVHAAIQQAGAANTSETAPAPPRMVGAALNLLV